jgi:predicted TIM-barrel fold metal-dependent hydrolase
VFEDPDLRGAPVVLLHESYPYTAEAAYLAAVYDNAYLDLAFSLPPLSRKELERVVSVALGVAPVGKLMCSSDGTRIPEHFYLGATRARLCLEQVLNEMVDQGDLALEDAQTAGTMILRDNARRVYRLPTA